MSCSFLRVVLTPAVGIAYLVQSKLIKIVLCCQGERSGPSKEAVPSDKQAQEDKVEEGHVKDSNKQTETAPWAS